ncbi:hypothetical protein D910_12219 [Dendroctonus ponderosae]|uniref:Uncharacterized protein n=1 Tax=Dendroctonus ponderosae TaxID=77166 RepID=U4UPA4_DENPD|nr:hypothetical protein D910_12219 [Dendroctonus ponderosae]
MSFRPCCVPISAMIFVLNVQPIVKPGDIPGPSLEYVHGTLNIATVPGSKDTLSRESSTNHSARKAPELCTPKKIKDDILDSPFTAVTSTNSARATQFRG